MKLFKAVIKGFLIGGFTSLLANLITFHSFQWYSIFMGSIIGLIIYIIFHIESL